MTGEVVGYVYAADTFCPACITEMLMVMPNQRVWTAEELLDWSARRQGIDRTDEETFDSDEFPKVIKDQMKEGEETCGRCHEAL